MPDEPNPTPEEKRRRRQQINQLRERLAQERAAWSRWMPRLRRAFHCIEKIDRRIARIERQIARLTGA